MSGFWIAAAASFSAGGIVFFAGYICGHRSGYWLGTIAGEQELADRVVAATGSDRIRDLSVSRIVSEDKIDG